MEQAPQDRPANASEIMTQEQTTISDTQMETGTQVTLSSQTHQGINPEKESFWGSKSMILLVHGFIHDMILFFVGAAASVHWHSDISTLVLGMAGVAGVKTVAGVARNVVVDGPVRRQFNQAEVLPSPPTNRPTSSF